MKVHHLAWAGGKWLARTVGTLALWTLWLGLGLLLALQIYIACTNTLEVPRFAQRAIEERLALSGVHTTFGRTIFDPSGRVLIENVGIRLPGFEEQVVTARAVYVRLDPWALAVGRFEPLELRVTGMSLRVPAMLSPSGRADEIVHDVDGAFIPRGDELGIEYLNFRLGAVGITAHGALHLTPATGERTSPLPLVDFLAHNYAAFSREFADAVELFGVLDQPSVEVELAPSAEHGGTAQVTLIARSLKLQKPDLQAAGLVVTGSFPFLLAGTAPVGAELDFAADQLNLPHGAIARGVAGRLEVRLPPGRFKFEQNVFRKVEFTAASFSAGGLALESPIVTLSSAGLPKVRAQILSRLFGSPFFIQSSVDLGAGTADALFHGELAPGLIDPLGLRLKRDLRKYVDLASPMAVDGAAEFGAGWKFQRGEARLAARGLTVRGVRIDEARARVEFDGRRLAAPELHVRLGEDAVGGSYTEDIASRDYRFLVSGRLRPLDISPWFNSWWSEFFGKFSFTAAPPEASADVRSTWGNPRKAAVFVAVDSGPVAYGGVGFDGLRARLFIRPTLDDGLEFQVRRGGAAARGSFAIARRYGADGAAGLRSVDFDLRSALDVGPLANIFGPRLAPVLAPFVFAAPPAVTARGHFDGPAAPGGAHRTLHVEVGSPGGFQYHEFPFQGVSFVVDEDDDRIAVQKVGLGFAGGAVSGEAKIHGVGAAQRLEFTGALKGASLGQAIVAVGTYRQRHAHAAPPVLSNFVKAKSNVGLDLTVSAAGNCDDFLSFQGGGTARLHGSELGEVRMLGLLSELFQFTKLHFTSAQADFQIAGPRLIFPDVSITGANSGIRAHGTYGLAKHDLDFKAKVYPFEKSRSLPGELMGGVLTPLSKIFEVKLTGTIEKPAWSL